MEAIQVQTPPKDDDLEMPELSVPPEDFDSDESAGEEEESEPIATPEPWPVEEAELVVEETRDDEIVVEDQNEGKNGANRNGNEDGESVLSSPPDSDAEPDTSKTGDPEKLHDVKVRKSKPTRPIGEQSIKLGDVEGIKARLDKRLGSDELLKDFHRVLYKRPGKSTEVKKNIREFSGFKYADKVARQAMSDKISKLMNAQLKEISAILGLQVSGSKDSLVEALVDFLDSPWDTKVNSKKSKRRTSGKPVKPERRVSTEKTQPPKKRKAVVPEHVDDEEEVSADEDDQPPPKKKVKATPTKKAKPKSAPLSKARITSPAEDLESSDDDLPLRRRPMWRDADIKFAIREFLQGKDLATVTKGMVKEALRGKYGDDIVKRKREIIAEGIMEGMNS